MKALSARSADGLRDRYYLLGDEDCGVGVNCHDCWDDGRPIAYYSPDRHLKIPYIDDPAVENVATIGGLLVAIDAHDRSVHSQLAGVAGIRR